jgi:hypothetical protein
MRGEEVVVEEEEEEEKEEEGVVRCRTEARGRTSTFCLVLVLDVAMVVPLFRMD